MEKPQKISFVTVFYEKELKLLQLQARSIAKFFPRDEIGEIIIVANQCDFDTARYVDRVLLPEYGSLQDRVVITSFRQLFPHYAGTTYTSGWSYQQPCKIAASRLVSTDCYVILDCKNHFVRPSGMEDFVSPSGHMRAEVWPGPQNEFVADFMDATLDYFGVARQEEGMETFGIVTPFVVRTRTMWDLMEYVHERESTCLAMAFDRYGWRWAEFYLIYFYMHCVRPELLDQYQIAHNRIDVAFWKDSAIGSIHSLFTEPKMAMLTIHGQKYPRLTPGEKNSIAQFWLDVGLVANRDDAEFFFTPPS